MRDLGSNEGATKVPEVSAEIASLALDCRRVSLDCWPTSFIVLRRLKSDSRRKIVQRYFLLKTVRLETCVLIQ